MKFKIPPQADGGSSDTVSERKFGTETAAADFYKIVQSRLLNISDWERFAGEEKAEFSLCEPSGLLRKGEPQIGDLIKIKIPGLHNPTGDKYDWVVIEHLEQRNHPDWEGIYIRVRPTQNPADDEDKTAHFFADKATSNFIALREGKVVKTMVFGRNEVPNTEDLNLLEKMRNAVVAIGGMLAGSKFQWKSLTDGLLEDEP